MSGNGHTQVVSSLMIAGADLSAENNVNRNVILSHDDSVFVTYIMTVMKGC